MQFYSICDDHIVVNHFPWQSDRHILSDTVALFTSVGLASYLEVVETVHKRKELPFQTDCTSRTSLPGWDYR